MFFTIPTYEVFIERRGITAENCYYCIILTRICSYRRGRAGLVGRMGLGYRLKLKIKREKPLPVRGFSWRKSEPGGTNHGLVLVVTKKHKFVKGRG